MEAREFIISILNSITARRVIVIISFALALVGIYVFAPTSWHDFLLDKSPAFMPLGTNLFDVLALSLALLIALIFYSAIKLITFIRPRLKILSNKKIKKIYSDDYLSPDDRGILIAMTFEQSLPDSHPAVITAKHKLKISGLTYIGYGGYHFVKNEVKTFIFNEVSAGRIDIEKLFPDQRY